MMLEEMQKKKVRWLIREGKVQKEKIIQEHKACIMKSLSKEKYNECFDEKLNSLAEMKEDE